MQTSLKRLLYTYIVEAFHINKYYISISDSLLIRHHQEMQKLKIFHFVDNKLNKQLLSNNITQINVSINDTISNIIYFINWGVRCCYTLVNSHFSINTFKQVVNKINISKVKEVKIKIRFPEKRNSQKKNISKSLDFSPQSMDRILNQLPSYEISIRALVIQEYHNESYRVLATRGSSGN